MTITRQDVQAVSAGPHPGGAPLPAAQLDRIAAVLNRHSTHRPAPSATDPHPTDRDASSGAPVAAPATATATAPAASVPVAPQSPTVTRPRQQVLDVMQRAGYPPEQIQQASNLLPETVDSQHDSAVLAQFGLTAGELMERMGASP